MKTRVKNIIIPTLTESLKKQKEMVEWWLANVDKNGNIKITTDDIIKQKEKELKIIKNEKSKAGIVKNLYKGLLDIENKNKKVVRSVKK